MRHIAPLTMLAIIACGATPAQGFFPIDRWQTTASGPASPRGDPVTLTWSLVPDGTPLTGGATSELVQLLDTTFDVGSGEGDLAARSWFPVVADAFDRWSELGGVTLRYEPSDDGALHRGSPGILAVRGDIRLAARAIDGLSGVVAASEYPDSGDIWLDTDDFWQFGNPAGDYLTLRNVLMHEIGHALGLDHVESDDAAILMEPRLQFDFDGPQVDDIRGLHYLYGDRYERVAEGNDTPPSATVVGELQSGGRLVVGGDGSHALIGPDHFDLVSIDSKADRDYYAFDVVHPGWLDLWLVPLGGTYLQGEVGAPQLSIDAGASNNLNLALYGPEAFGATAPARRAGEVEAMQGLYLPRAGRYVVEVTGSRDAVQLYQLEFGYTRVVDEPLYAMLLTLMIPLLKLHGRLARS